MPNECEPLLGSKTCWGSKAEAHFDKEGVLRVTARCVATIDSFDSLGQGLFNDIYQASCGHNFVLTARRLLVRLRQNYDLYPNESIPDALCRTLHCNRFSESYLPHIQGFSHLQDSRDAMLRIIRSNEWSSSLDSIFPRIKGRVFFTTEEGHIGLAPHRIDPGD